MDYSRDETISNRISGLLAQLNSWHLMDHTYVNGITASVRKAGTESPM